MLTVYLLEQLPQIAEGMSRALLSLSSNNPTTPAMCEMVAIQLAGAHQYCLTLAAAIKADQDGTEHRHWLGEFIKNTLPVGDGEVDA
ncbi:hypothetical protein ASD14_10345 [Lysobacter sp. Root494]|nr:hypothetical protein ASD14_10345 [Lysobacter sp. Root494]